MARLNASDYAHPKRLWLRLMRRGRIRELAFAYLPKPYDLASIYLKVRTGKEIESPTTLLCYQTPLNGQEHGALPVGPANAEAVAAPKGFGQPQIITGAEALALYGYGVATKLHAVDRHVYEAMSNLSGLNIDSLGDLSSSMQHWQHDFWTGLPDGGLSKLSGHLGEVYAAEHLENAGVQVEWPATSNQQGWDLILDGHAVNVKTVADAQELHSHFAANPDIPAIVPSDAANIPAGAFHLTAGESAEPALRHFLEHSDASHKIIVDPGLSHEAVSRQGADASDAALGGASIADVCFPWITAATSSWREWQLLNNSKTDLETAAKHVALDVVGRGVGAAVGAKGGAVFGSVLGPVGTAIGSVVGAIAGALLGGSKTDEIKLRPLREAERTLARAKQDLDSVARDADSQARDQFERARRSEQKPLAAQAARERAQIAAKLQELKQWRDSVADFLPAEVAARLIAEAREELSCYRVRILERLRERGVVRRVIWPGPGDLAREDALRDVGRFDEKLGYFGERAGGGHAINQAELFAEFSRWGVVRRFVEFGLTDAENTRREREASVRADIMAAYRRLGIMRTEAFRRLSERARQLKEEVRRKLAPAVAAAAAASKRLANESRKLGRA